MLTPRQKPMPRTSLTLCVMAGLALPAATLADDSRIWASQCFQCHGTNGYPVGDMDEIGGESAKSLYEAVIEMKYRGKTEGIMDLHARGYSDQQLRLIAEYIAAQGEGENPEPQEIEDDDSEDDE